MKINAYKFTFSYADPMKGGITRAKNTQVILADSDYKAMEEASYIISQNKEIGCQLENVKKVEHGRLWRVIMNGIAEYDEYGPVGMKKVLFIDCKSAYDAEQVACRLWERQIKEEGFSSINIWSTRVLPPQREVEEEAE